MATKLDKTIRREIEIDGRSYTLAISPEGVRITRKGFRKGRELDWRRLLAASTAEDGGRPQDENPKGNRGGGAPPPGV